MLIETIKIKNQQFQNITYHNQRLNDARKTLFQASDYWDIQKMISLPPLDAHAIYKCRLTYAEEIIKIEIEPYFIRPICSLKMVNDNKIDYAFKYADRNLLGQLYGQREDCDDILIIKNGMVTDTFYCNIAFFDGKDWFTPDVPLLEGTQRKYLLEAQVIKAKNIFEGEIYNFQAAKLFNAMMDWEEAQIIDIKNIK